MEFRDRYGQYLPQFSLPSGERYAHYFKGEKYAKYTQYLSKLPSPPSIFALDLQASIASYRVELAGRLPTLMGFFETESVGSGSYWLFLSLLLVPGLTSWLVFDHIHTDDDINRITTETQSVFLFSALFVFALLSAHQYYRLNILESPRITYSPTASNMRLMESFSEHLRPFAPTPWALSGHIQSFLFAYWPLNLALGYGLPKVVEREEVEFDDGGVVALDWFDADSDDAPVLVILPGVVGKSQNIYVQRIAVAAREKGWRAVCKSYRGIGVNMRAPKPETWCQRVLLDLDVCLNRIKTRYPNAPLMIVGYSFGGMQVLSYMGNAKNRTVQLDGAVSISGVFNAAEIYNHGLKPHVFPPYDMALYASIAVDMSASWDVISNHLGVDVATVLRKLPLTFYSWHDAVTCRLEIDGMTLNTVDEYFEYLGQFHSRFLSQVDQPVLCFIGKDDPLVPPIVGDDARRVALEADGPILVETMRGGHCGWFEGWQGHSWIDDMSVSYLQCCLQEARKN